MEKSDAYLETFTAEANDCIQFKIIKNIEDIDVVKPFSPSLSHQFFGENEKIFGYKGLLITIYLSPYSLSPCFTYTFEEKLEDSRIKADDVDALLTKQIPDCHRSLASLKAVLSNEGAYCFGKLINEYKGKDEETHEIRHVTGDDLLSPCFQKFNEHLQYLLLFFVDGSSFIDITDPDWEYFILYAKKTDISTQKLYYATMGYMTVHNFYSYPDKTRQRISQILILPPFQKQGHGENFLRGLYNQAIANDSIRDVTVEDASDEFQALRDYVDCCNTLHLSDFNSEMVKSGMWTKFNNLLKLKLKLNTKQIIRVYEILGLKFVNKANPMEGLKYKQAVIRRLMGICGSLKEFSHTTAQSQLSAVMEQKAVTVERDYDRLEMCYSAVITKLNKEGIL